MIKEIHRRTVISALPAAFALAGLSSGARAQSSVPAPTPQVVASLAPTGRLRAGINLGNPVLAQKNSTTGAVGGLIVDIANEVGRRLGTPVDMIYYDTGGKIAPAQPADKWDIAFIGNAQAPEFDFTPPYLYVDATYLVAQDAPYQRVADLDRPGVRITAALNSAYDQVLSRTLKNATLVRGPTSAASIDMFIHDKLEAAAGVRQTLTEAQRANPGLRVLPDSFTRVDQAIAVPRGREAGLRYLSLVIEELKASGFVKNALDRTGQSASLSPPQALR